MTTQSIQARANPEKNGIIDFPGAPISPIEFFTINLAGIQNDGIPAWSYYPTIRDRYLRALSKREPIMAGALYSVVSRIKSLRWHIPTGGRNTKKYYQELFANADGGAGFGQFISKVVTDLLTQDNGAFIELVGAGKVDKPLKGRVKEIWHLDSAQCWRTFDPEFPVIYTNPLDNSYHRIHKSRVIMLSSNPQPDERARNVGFCAVSRALKMMTYIRNIETYKDEKVTGRFKRGIIYGNGVTPKQFKESTEQNEMIAEAQNYTMYNEIPVLLSMLPDMKLSMLDLASLPDGFDYEKEVTLYVYILALCFGTDAREFWPATASGATKADASIQHLKAQGKGIADIIKMIETAFNWQIMPSNGESDFEYDFTDDEQDKLVAELHRIKAENIGLYQDKGWIDALEARALAIREGLIDPAALSLTDTPEQADDSAPLDDENVIEETADSIEEVAGAIDEFEFDPLTATKAVTGKFEEQKHERDSSGRFGSGGSTTNESAKPKQDKGENVSPEASGQNLTPLAARLRGFLTILNQAGTYKDGELTTPRSNRDRSKDLQTYLRNKGFPDATVSARRVGKGYVYTINAGAPGAKKPRKRRTRKGTEKKLGALKKGVDATAYKRLAKYEQTLEDMLQDFLDTAKMDNLDKQLDKLYNEFADGVEKELSAAFGIGLAGADPTKPGIKKLKAIGQKSADYFKDSFLPDLKAEVIASVTSDTKDLNSFLSRIKLYAGSFWESIWQGVGDRTPVTLKVKRRLDPAAKHCKTCPDKEKVYNSFEEMEQVAGVPGDGSDDCKTNCRCTLEVETEPGSDSFESLVGKPTVFTVPLFEVLR